MDLSYNGIFGLLVFVADVWAIINVLQGRISNGTKLVWVLVVLVLPLLGVIIWYFAGPRGKAV